MPRRTDSFFLTLTKISLRSLNMDIKESLKKEIALTLAKHFKSLSVPVLSGTEIESLLPSYDLNLIAYAFPLTLNNIYLMQLQKCLV